MKVFERLKAHFAKEKERMAPMTTRQKIDHIWTYYKDYMWIGAVVAILLGAMTSSLINLGKTDVVTGIMVNLTLDQKGMNYLQEDYHAHIGADPFWDRVKVEYTAFTALTDESNSEQNYYAAMTVVAEVSAEKLDYMILDKVGMEFYITQAVYMDLRNFFTEEELAEFESKGMLINAQREDSTEAFPVAIKISDTAFAKDCITAPNTVYFSVITSTPRVETCRVFWDYLMAWEPKAE